MIAPALQKALGGLTVDGAFGPLTELHARLDIARDAGSEADVVVEARVEAHDDRYQLSYLQARGARFSVVRADLPPGSHARLRILARDVSITLQHQSDTSILNILPARVDEVVGEVDLVDGLADHQVEKAIDQIEQGIRRILPGAANIFVELETRTNA